MRCVTAISRRARVVSARWPRSTLAAPGAKAQPTCLLPFRGGRSPDSRMPPIVTWNREILRDVCIGSTLVHAWMAS